VQAAQMHFGVAAAVEQRGVQWVAQNGAVKEFKRADGVVVLDLDDAQEMKRIGVFRRARKNLEAEKARVEKLAFVEKIDGLFEHEFRLLPHARTSYCPTKGRVNAARGASQKVHGIPCPFKRGSVFRSIRAEFEGRDIALFGEGPDIVIGIIVLR